MITPILRAGDILITSIQTDLTDRQAVQLQEEILAEVARNDSHGLVIDVTAMELMDSFMARVLNDTATMVQLMGARTVVVGMRPLVALTLVEMGRPLVGVEAALNLEQGLARLRRLIGDQVLDHAGGGGHDNQTS